MEERVLGWGRGVWGWGSTEELGGHAGKGRNFSWWPCVIAVSEARVGMQRNARRMHVSYAPSSISAVSSWPG